MSKDRRDWMDESGNVRDAGLNALLRDFRSAVTHVALHDPERQCNPEFTTLLKDFRSAVTHVALRESERLRTAAGWSLATARRRERHRLVMSWSAGAAVLCAAVLCVVLLPMVPRGHQAISSVSAVVTAASESQAPVAPQAASASGSNTASAESDAALLEAVDTDVSTSVPPSLAPLVVMENWTSAPAEPSSASSESESAANPTEDINVDH